MQMILGEFDADEIATPSDAEESAVIELGQDGLLSVSVDEVIALRKKAWAGMSKDDRRAMVETTITRFLEWAGSR